MAVIMIKLPELLGNDIGKVIEKIKVTNLLGPTRGGSNY